MDRHQTTIFRSNVVEEPRSQLVSRPVSLLTAWLLVSIGVVAEMVGAVLLKSSDGFSKAPQTIGTLLIYGIAVIFLSRALEVLPLGITIAVWAGVGVSVTAVLGMLVFGEKPTFSRVCSIGLITVGIVLVGLFTSGSHP